MRPVLVLSDYFVKLVIPAFRAIQKPAVIYRFVSLRKTSHFGPAGTKLVLNGKKCKDSAWTGTIFSLAVSDLSLVSEA